LKPLSLGDRAIVLIVFPRLRRRGPIEAASTAATGSPAPRVSTPEEAWPH